LQSWAAFFPEVDAVKRHWDLLPCSGKPVGWTAARRSAAVMISLDLSLNAPSLAKLAVSHNALIMRRIRNDARSSLVDRTGGLRLARSNRESLDSPIAKTEPI